MPRSWTAALAALSPNRRRAMTFLYDHLPESDLDCYPFSLFLQFADHALLLRESAPWCAALEQEIFDHYVLFPRVNNEDLSFHRKLFYDALWPRIREIPTIEAKVLEVNRWCHEIASYQAQDDRTASPLTVFRCGSGRCGEESAFLVCALRSVGIPARQVYAPRWAHCDDNHAWVEALCNGVWRFLGACEPEPVLDRGWFNTSASRAILVHSRLFGAGASPLHGALLGQEGGVFWYNQTARYARVRSYTFRALRGGIPAPGAVFQLQLLNEAGFHTIATLTSDGNGEARAALGLGDIHVLAVWDGLCAEGDCANGAITLPLAPPAQDSTPWAGFDFHAPEAHPVNPTVLNAGQRAERAAVLQSGSALRERRIASWNSSEAPAWADLLRAARGNRGEIAAFLAKDGDPRRELLLRTLTHKDLRDAAAETLEDHLQNTPAPGALPPEIYASYVLCPRIEWEPLTPWRGLLRHALPAGLAEPAALWDWLNHRINTRVERAYADLVWTPAEAWRAGRCDQRSLRILYVALLRSQGIPARLRGLDGVPEFWRSGAFHPVLSEETGILSLRYDAPLVYGQSWTLSRWTGSRWQLLSLPDGIQTARLPAGRYRLITTARLPNGNQFAAKRELLIRPGAAHSSTLSLRPYALEDMLRRQAMPVIPAVTLAGGHVPDLCRMDRRPTLLLWLEEGSEPTEHLLNELAAGRQSLETLPLKILFLLRGRDSLRQPTLSGLLAQWENIRVLLDDWHYDLENVARQLTCDPSTPPLAVVCDGDGQAVYGISGYRVGSVELLTRVCAHICKTWKQELPL